MAPPRWNPPKVTLTNLNTGVSLVAQFNPSQLSEALEATYAPQTVVGLSHQVLHFVATGNEKFELDLFFRATTETELQRLRIARRFLKSLLYPRAGAEDVAGGGAPRVLLVWPRMLSLVCVVKTLNFEHTHFTQQAQSRAFTAKVTLEEIRDVRITSEDVMDDVELRFGHVPGGDIPEARRTED